MVKRKALNKGVAENCSVEVKFSKRCGQNDHVSTIKQSTGVGLNLCAPIMSPKHDGRTSNRAVRVRQHLALQKEFEENLGNRFHASWVQKIVIPSCVRPSLDTGFYCKPESTERRPRKISFRSISPFCAKNRRIFFLRENNPTALQIRTAARFDLFLQNSACRGRWKTFSSQLQPLLCMPFTQLTSRSPPPSRPWKMKSETSTRSHHNMQRKERRRTDMQ